MTFSNSTHLFQLPTSGVACIYSRLSHALTSPKFYSPDPAQLFSGIVACASDIPQGDKEAISGALVAFGGQWRQALTRDVTHLFALAPVGEKYKKAMLYKQNMAHQTLDDDDDILTMHVVLPHWFDDSFKLQTLLPTAPYEFPNPHILSVSGAFSASGSDKLNERGRGDANSDMGFAMRLKVATQRARDRDRAALLKSVAHSEKNGGIGSLLGPGRVSEGGVWGGRRIMFSESLEVDEMRRGSLEVSVSRAGGVVVAVGHEGAEMENVDILITRYRGGDEFDRALKVHKTIGTLAWLFHVEQTGRLTAPVDRLLHFPVPRDPIEGFVGADITVTNYAGEARDYLKKLITTIGGSFSPTMSAKTSYVIAAYIGGAKTTRARDWDIPVVNHTYLEDCFVEWRKINLVGGTGKYAAPETPGVNLMCVLGERGLGKIVAGVGPVDASVRRKERKETKGKSSEEAREAAKDVGGPSKTAGRARSADEAKTAAKKQPLITNADGMHADHADGVAGDQPDDVEMQAPDNDDDDLQPPVEMDIDRPPPRTPPRSSSPKRPFIAKPMKPTSATTDDLPMETEGEPAPALDPVTPKPPAKRVKRAPKVKPTSEIEDAPSASTSAPTSNPVLSRGREEDQAQPVLHHRTSSSSTAMRLPNIASSPPNPNHLSTPSGPSSARRPSGLMRGTDPDAILPTSSRRKAGMAATKKLHEEIMPDVMQYQKQMRSTQGDVRRMKLGEKRTRANESEDDEEGAESEREAEKEAEGAKEKERKKEKETVVKDKGKGKQKEKVEDEKPVRQPPAKVQKTQKSQNAPRNSAGTQRAKSKEDSPLSSLESEDDGPPPAPAPVEPQKGAKMIKKAQVRRKSAPEKVDDDPSDAGTQTTKAKGGRDADTASVASFAGSAKSSKVVRIMTTQVSLSDADVKALGKLGAKITVKPAECTHLVAKSIGRTEKFLCAMPLSPYILSENWIRSSIAAKKLLDEESYLLKDPANEAKYNFKLSEALERAKEGKLLEGLTFYVTPKVSVEFKTLKNVVSSAGGNLVKQTPTSRVLSSAKDRYVLSCAEDASIWRPLATQGITIYSADLVLTGVLKQQLDWNTFTVGRS
ncbi:hypothetical protein BOTBODRAFT_616780 [Botryobasidium botryosum FD-172 SS1]|uniref:BRCT domain-containing protein n=1 Tax=Botryobasidium botryosum (strain FD-172 SS1) TaxID=930990 RepID=A0A067M5H4_BOTB1|nr:hypothetical protein BOTBODRAFT_616780 [Botryobasidium botryosum FD-172 SS1]